MRREAQTDSPGELLREKLVAFQREIAELKQQAKEREDSCLRRERELYTELFEVLDVFDNLELHLRRRPEPLDKSGHHLLNSMRAVQRKLHSLLSSRQIEPLDFPDRRAQVGQCAVVETKPAPGRENEEILAVLRRGYRDAARDLVLRKAEVVTVRNE
ncbi:MAG: nucleotide exchange factor GrpE [Candidatus Electronema sp. V4]|uniref:nucleotide exchange factor GrpE n=1 Tax=Candidatus Electronema sp. V4 TaxID=3454756 RepID=UPI004055783A